jgi:hypothetical protein
VAGGRTNHYFFDLNRDWLPAQHPESRGRLELFHRWRPQLHTDFHEMGGDATYFFQPGVPSRNNPNTPQRVRPDRRGRALPRPRAGPHRRALLHAESVRRLLLREGLDLPGRERRDRHPLRAGLLAGAAKRDAVRRADYAFTIRNQFLTRSRPSRRRSEMRETLLRHQRDFYREAPTSRAAARSGRTSGATDGTAPARRRSRRCCSATGSACTSWPGTARTDRRFEARPRLVVPVDQPQARLILGAMERVRVRGLALLRRERLDDAARLRRAARRGAPTPARCWAASSVTAARRRRGARRHRRLRAT